MSSQDVDEILSKLHRYNNSHPILSKLWTTFILYRQNRLHQSIQDCNAILSNFNEIDDMHPLSILLLSFICKNSDDRLNT